MARTRAPELNAYQKGRIDAYRDLGYSYGHIEQILHIPKTTIGGYIRRSKNRESIENKKHTGRPRKSTERDDRFLIRKAIADTKMPLRELQWISNSNLSISGIKRRLHEDKIRKWRAAERARLTPAHVAKRFQCAKEHLHWLIEQWRAVIFSDECSGEKGKDPRQVWVFRRPRAKERYKPENVVGKNKGKGISLMVWGCFAGDIKGPLVSFEGVNTAATYIETLKQHLVPLIEFLRDELPQELANDIIYQQDNASIHTAKATEKWFKDMAITVMEWPPNSPNMNPIEHIWRALKAALYARFPDTVAIPGGPETVRKELGRRLEIVWEDLEPEVFDNLIMSMPRRVTALYNAKGWYTQY
jgi:transposase